MKLFGLKIKTVGSLLSDPLRDLESSCDLKEWHGHSQDLSIYNCCCNENFS